MKYAIEPSRKYPTKYPCAALLHPFLNLGLWCSYVVYVVNLKVARIPEGGKFGELLLSYYNYTCRTDGCLYT
jgi:hypothetical protein